MERMTVAIPVERYEELLKTEVRLNISVERICHDRFVSMEDLLRILGTEQAIERANELKEASERYRKDMNNE